MILLASAGAQQRETEEMFAQVAAEKLAQGFASPGVSYLLYDMERERFLVSHWNGSRKPIPVGSLVKPFTALAYAESHDYRFPGHLCNGGSTCWLPKGHGNLRIAHAIGVSCNSYFVDLAAQTGAAQVASVAQRYGLNGPLENASPEAMAGMYGQWQESPESVVRAYALLLQRAQLPAVRDIVDGMAEAARSGTAAALSPQGLHLLAKTGTSACTHEHRATADGFVLVAWPAELPRYLLLVREHGVTGASCAALGGRMIRALEPSR
jgi:cell division protein FtsI/penicillin-binding protein 2